MCSLSMQAGVAKNHEADWSMHASVPHLNRWLATQITRLFKWFRCRCRHLKRAGVMPTQGSRGRAVALESASLDGYRRLDMERPGCSMHVTESTPHQDTPTLSFGLAEWLGLAALAFGSLHILLDFGIGLFPTQGPVSAAVAASFILTSLILLWWAVSMAASVSGLGGGAGECGRAGVRLDAADQRVLGCVLPTAVPGCRATGRRGAPGQSRLRPGRDGRRCVGAQAAPAESWLAPAGGRGGAGVGLDNRPGQRRAALTALARGCAPRAEELSPPPRRALKPSLFMRLSRVRVHRGETERVRRGTNIPAVSARLDASRWRRAIGRPRRAPSRRVRARDRYP